MITQATSFRRGPEKRANRPSTCWNLPFGYSTKPGTENQASLRLPEVILRSEDSSDLKGIAMTPFTNTRFLAIYSGLLTLAFAAVVVFGIGALRNRTFGTITARRVNIVEPDGTVRLTISNRADFPGAWNRGKEYPRPDRREAAGMLFMSDEGTEQGGFIWGAGQLPDGSIQNHVHLSFDQYEENQVFAIDAGQEGKDKFSQ